MNGLLHRLAARAAGKAALVGADARLSYRGDTLARAEAPDPRFAPSRDAVQPAAPGTPPAARRTSPAGIPEQGPPPRIAEPIAAGGPFNQERPGIALQAARDAM